MIWVNCAIKACSVDANPFETFIVLWIAITPVFNSFDSTMKENSTKFEESLESDELPISIPQGIIPAVKYKPSLWVFLKSTIFMSYLLNRRSELTPDLFHFITCVEQD